MKENNPIHSVVHHTYLASNISLLHHTNRDNACLFLFFFFAINLMCKNTLRAFLCANCGFR